MRREIRSTIVFSLLAAVFGTFVYLQLALGLFADRTSPSPVKHNSIILRFDASEQSLIQENRRPSRSYARKSTLDAVLLPDWEVLVLFSHLPENPFSAKVCLFQNGDKSPARPAGILLSGNRAASRCKLPPSVRRLRPFEQPKLVTPENEHTVPESSPEMIRWTFLVYETLSTETDVILFAKGVNSRQGANLPAKALRCVFDDDDNKVYTPVVSSSQEVFRCLHPDLSTRHLLSVPRISLEIDGHIIPSVAYYKPLPIKKKPLAAAGKHQLCACTMVFNVAKFLKEWVIYHSSLGVEHFILYDNGSEDDLEKVVEDLKNYNVTKLMWPWPKTQEAGFSHCATFARDSCNWMMFIDVDEFVFSPSWKNLTNPSPVLLKSLLPNNTVSSNRPIGQIGVRCLEFGPSNQRSHPSRGVIQGYNCRRRSEQRHKSIVLLKAVDLSLLNVVHHFQLKKSYRGRRLSKEEGVVNHYKYQAWSEFKAKFRRRVSAYVVDWKQTRNPASKDRTPGLGYAPIEPFGWASKFCEVNDSRLQRLSWRWFGLDTPTGSHKMLWEGE